MRFDVLNRFDVDHECYRDRQTDRETDRRTDGRTDGGRIGNRANKTKLKLFTSVDYFFRKLYHKNSVGARSLLRVLPRMVERDNMASEGARTYEDLGRESSGRRIH